MLLSRTRAVSKGMSAELLDTHAINGTDREKDELSSRSDVKLSNWKEKHHAVIPSLTAQLNVRSNVPRT